MAGVRDATLYWRAAGVHVGYSEVSEEGFGLTVTEALWKGNPTIAGAVGGIPNQIIQKLTGVLVHSVEGCAFQIRYLLTHPEFARRIGMNGREQVRENFLIKQ